MSMTFTVTGLLTITILRFLQAKRSFAFRALSALYWIYSWSSDPSLDMNVINCVSRGISILSIKVDVFVVCKLVSTHLIKFEASYSTIFLKSVWSYTRL